MAASSITASTCNTLDRYSSSPHDLADCYAKLAVFFPSSGQDRRRYSMCLHLEIGQTELAWLAGLNVKLVKKRDICQKSSVVTYPSALVAGDPVGISPGSLASLK